MLFSAKMGLAHFTHASMRSWKLHVKHFLLLSAVYNFDKDIHPCQEGWFGSTLDTHQKKLTSWSKLSHEVKKLVRPKGVKIDAEKGWVVKECYISFFNWFNFDFMVWGQFPPWNQLKNWYNIFICFPKILISEPLTRF